MSHVRITLVEERRSTLTDVNGYYEFDGIIFSTHSPVFHLTVINKRTKISQPEIVTSSHGAATWTRDIALVIPE